MLIFFFVDLLPLLVVVVVCVGLKSVNDIIEAVER